MCYFKKKIQIEKFGHQNTVVRFKKKDKFAANTGTQKIKIIPTMHVYVISVAGAGVFGWSRSRFFHPAPAPDLRYILYISRKKMPTA